MQAECQDARGGHRPKVVCTGGGTHNTFALELLKAHSGEQFEWVVPSRAIVEFKEAIIFGLLGVKYLEGVRNCSRGVGGQLAKGKEV
jgi:anhydro-N-acetylmuramic acid kinase